mgnify:CR=1 FL=1
MKGRPKTWIAGAGLLALVLCLHSCVKKGEVEIFYGDSDIEVEVEELVPEFVDPAECKVKCKKVKFYRTGGIPGGSFTTVPFYQAQVLIDDTASIEGGGYGRLDHDI